MTKENFIELLKKPGMLDDKTIEALDGVIYQYPYFQAAHGLYLLNLKKNENSKYSLRLSSSAAYSADRRRLFCLLNEIDITKIEGQFNTKTQITNMPSDTVDLKPAVESEEMLLIDDSKGIETEITAGSTTNPVSSGQITEKAPELLELEINELKEKNIENEKIDSGKENPETSLVEKTIKKPERGISDYFTNDPQIEEKSQESDLIEKFIKEKPSMPKMQTLKVGQNSEKEDKVIDYSINSVEESDDFITETLANLYLDQGNIEKAIETFKKLSLKYPEKSTYFATQIKKIQNIT